MIPMPTEQFEAIQVIRGAAGSYAVAGAALGMYDPGAGATVDMQASVQPMPGEELVKLGLGDQVVEGIEVFAEDAIFGKAEGDSGQDADTIVWAGKHYQVVLAERWAMGQLDHYRAVATRKRSTL